ncbi:TPA: hypothetical protein MYR09_003791 [Citrobacter farmeri]|uniref:hypothetical protein n=1 Tax=Citrobacter farmeri TaxID=67824 RepID=UPI00388E7D93|nr:hypothetical protein [Citrobacter farmeri]
MFRYLFLTLYLISLSVVAFDSCDKDPDYLKFYGIKKKMEDKNYSIENTFRALNNELLHLETCREMPSKDVYNLRRKLFSYVQNGEKVSASSIYDCDSVSFNGICTKKTKMILTGHLKYTRESARN